MFNTVNLHLPVLCVYILLGHRLIKVDTVSLCLPVRKLSKYGTQMFRVYTVGQLPASLIAFMQLLKPGIVFL